MTYSAADTIKFETANRDHLSAGTRAYFRARTRNRLYDLVMTKFRDERDRSNLTQVQLARRMGKRPEVLSRLLKGPANWTIDTLCDFLLATVGEEIDASSTSPLAKPQRNRDAAEEFRDHSGRAARTERDYNAFNRSQMQAA